MRRRPEPLSVPSRLPYFMVDCGPDLGAHKFRRLPDSTWVRQWNSIGSVMMSAEMDLQRFGALARKAQALLESDPDSPETLAACEAVQEAMASQAEVLEVIQWTRGLFIALMWADPDTELECLTDYNDPERREKRWPDGEPDENLGHAAYLELYDAGWTGEAIATLCRVLLETQRGGHGVMAALSEGLAARVSFFETPPTSKG